MAEPKHFRPDPRFFDTRPPLDLIDAVRIADAELLREGAAREVSHVAPLRRAGHGAAVFVEKAAALSDIPDDAAPALVLTVEKSADAVTARFGDAAIATTTAPRAAFAKLAAALHEARAFESSAAERRDAYPNAVIAPDADIGENVVIGAFAVIGPGVRIGSGSVLGAHVSVTHADVGRDCHISSGVRIGEAGFGYAPDGNRAVRIPQLGRVLIGDHVDIGANSTVDRGALEDTIIGDGSKIDNLVQVAHNCVLGRGCLVASQTGISGSCVIGDGVMIGGQAGMADHLTIGDGALISAKAGLMKDVPPGERWGGIPAKPARMWMKEVAALSRLAEKGRSK